MKTTFTRKALALLLAVCMVLSLGSTALAAQEQSIPFRQVEADVPLEREPAGLPQDTSYAPTDLVRVSIVLEDRPVPGGQSGGPGPADFQSGPWGRAPGRGVEPDSGGQSDFRQCAV